MLPDVFLKLKFKNTAGIKKNNEQNEKHKERISHKWKAKKNIKKNEKKKRSIELWICEGT